MRPAGSSKRWDMSEVETGSEATVGAPLFVLGLQRSGTTWLANLLAGHSRVVAVEADDHFGVHESIFFSHFEPFYGDLTDVERRRRFVDDFAASDYFVLSGIDEEWLRNLQPESYAQCFRALMEEVARRRGGADYWLEKSPDHTLLAERLAWCLPDARFVGIVRSPLAVVQSRFWLHRRDRPSRLRRLLELASLAASTSLAQRYLERFCAVGTHRSLLRYEDLLADPEAACRRLCAGLGLSFEAEMLDERYRRNTSFGEGRSRSEALDGLDRAFTRSVLFLSDRLPVAALYRLWERERRRQGVAWPAWCWKRRGRPAAASGLAGGPGPEDGSAR